MQRWKPCLVAVVAPLVLAGCGAPVGVQVASLLADGLSFLTTEKTITDHGLSAVAGEDCAMWRGLRGEDICHDEATPDAPAVAEAGGFAFVAGDADVADFIPPAPAPATLAVAAAPAQTEWTPVAELVAKAEIAPEPVTAPAPVVAVETEPVAPVIVPVVEPVVEVETEPMAPISAVTAPALSPALSPAHGTAAPAPKDPPVRWEQHARGGTFLVIASYRRAANAERLARREAKLMPSVLAGKARGKRVFRVAVGPLAAGERRRLRRKLVAAGFADVWALTVTTPLPPAELAAAR